MAQENCNLISTFEDETDDEAPSLSDLPTAVEDHINDRRRSMSEPADFFEFRIPDFNSSSYTFSWNDLIWPLTHQQSPISPLLPPKTRRSESLNESKIATRYSSSSLLKSPCFRASRSLDYCRLKRNPSSKEPIRSNCADRASKAQARSPPWYWLMFGPLKFPQAAEIEVRRSGKNRQTRPPATMFPATEKGSGDRRGWKLISVLSCKSHASVAVTTPFQPYC